MLSSKDGASLTRDQNSVDVPKSASVQETESDVELTVIFSDDSVVVLDKPPGLRTVPGAGKPAADDLSESATRAQVLVESTPLDMFMYFCIYLLWHYCMEVLKKLDYVWTTIWIWLTGIHVTCHL